MAIKKKRVVSRRWLLFFGFILVTYVIFFSASYFFGKNVDFYFILAIYFVTSVIFWIGQSMHIIKKCFFIFFTFFITTSIGILLLFATIVIPGSKEHNHVMYKVCMPAIDKYYENKRMHRASPANDKNAAGQARWWMQHLECEENIRKGLGPVFSENPPGFPVIK